MQDEQRRLHVVLVTRSGATYMGRLATHGTNLIYLKGIEGLGDVMVDNRDIALLATCPEPIDD